LAALLGGYADPAPDQATRLRDVLPADAARALKLLSADLAGARFNAVRPPMTWLVEQAAQLPHGRLVGPLTADR
jgi:hypothetical protein